MKSVNIIMLIFLNLINLKELIINKFIIVVVQLDTTNLNCVLQAIIETISIYYFSIRFSGFNIFSN